ncbi:MAG: hypothetical protein Kow0042_06810 [Calditrichia bacterium]
MNQEKQFVGACLKTRSALHPAKDFSLTPKYGCYYNNVNLYKGGRLSRMKNRICSTIVGIEDTPLPFTILE